MGDSSTAPDPSSVWAKLERALGPDGQRPRLRAGLERQDFLTRRGEAYAILKNPAADTYLRLGPSESFLVDLMDGKHTVRDLVLAYLARYDALAFARVSDMLEQLHAGRFLAEDPRPVYDPLTERLAVPGRVGGLVATAARLSRLTFEPPGLDSWLSRQYRAWAWAVFTPAGLALCTTLGVLGFVLWLMAGLRGEPSPLALVSTPWMVAALLSLGALPVAAAHELAHAFTAKHFGRAVPHAGVRLVFGMPTVFVDTRDVWLAPRRARMAVALAGSISSFVIGGSAAILLAMMPESPLDPPLAGVVFVGYVFGLVHLIPALELDGYHLLAEWLEIPLLGPRALAFVRQDLLRKLRDRAPWTREERVLLLYGLFAVTATTIVALVGLLLWGFRARHLLDVAEASRGMLHLWFLGAALGVMGILIVLLARLLWLSGRASRSGIVYLAHLAREGRVEAALALLREVEMLSDLPPATLRAIADALRPRAVPAGAAVVREGDLGDAFYILMEGEATVSRRSADGEEQLLAVLRPGDYFGEIALLRQTPRTATVRGLTDLRVMRLGAAEFRRLLAGQIPEQTRGAIAARDDLSRCALLAHLGPRELELVRKRLRERRYPAGADLVRQGDPADGFYIVRDGQCEVLVRDSEGGRHRVNTLGPGDYFGEIALIQQSARTATVRAVDEVTVGMLSRDDFDDVLRRYFDLAGTLARTARQRAAASREHVERRHHRRLAELPRAESEPGRDQITTSQHRGHDDREQRDRGAQ